MAYEPIPDEDGFICWMHINPSHETNGHRLAATAALLAAAKIDFKILSVDGGWSTIHVRKMDTKSLEVLWNLSNMVDVEAPPVLRIVVPQQMDGVEAVHQEVGPAPNRFDEI